MSNETQTNPHATAEILSPAPEAGPSMTECSINANGSPRVAKIMPRLAKAQAAMGAAKKSSKNPHFKSSYADLAAVADVVMPALADAGIFVMQRPLNDRDGHVGMQCTMHFEDEFVGASIYMPLLKRDAQAVGSAMTYGRRYLLAAICSIATEDDDGNAASQGTASNSGGNSPTKSKELLGSAMKKRIREAPDEETLQKAREWAGNNLSGEPLDYANALIDARAGALASQPTVGEAVDSETIV